MRWVVLLLVMLNAFYYVWHQQEAPLRPKEVAPVSLYKSAHPGIRLLSESKTGQSSDAAGRAVADACLYLGGEIPRSDAKTIEQRLISLDIQTQFGRRQDEFGGVYWLKVEPESRRLVDDGLLAGLKQDFPQLKSKIMSCEGIATSD
jgi:hypothetical protein